MPTPEPIASLAWCERHRRRLLLAILVLSLGLRIWLAATGGQGYWPDEMRYATAARKAAWEFAHGTPREAWLWLIGQADHLLFKIVGLPVAFWELKFGNNGALVASWFGLFSVGSIGLMYAVARTAGASAREGLLAALFAAGASSLFYYCRHFLPYDVSLCLCLLALWFALGPPKWWRSLGAGLGAGMGFLAYNGYWMLGGAVLIVHVLAGDRGRRVLQRGCLAGLGLLVPIVAAVVGGRLLDRDLILSFREFSRTITQGDFGRGWIVVAEYFWSAEGLVGLGWLLLAAIGLRCIETRRRVILWLAVAGGLCVGLVVCSDVLRTFVVYGRTARMLVPFLCLAAAAGAEGLGTVWSNRAGRVGVLAVMMAAAGWHMATALRQVFPDGFLKLARARIEGEGRHSAGLVRVLNADPLGEGFVMDERRPHLVLLSHNHPLQFAPFLYEGIGEKRRSRFRKMDISMRLITVPGVTVPDVGGGFPGPVRLRVRFPAHRPGVSEPLLTSGESRRANFLFVEYLDANRIRFGFDAWNRKGVVGAPISIDPAQEHRVIVSTAAQLPADASPLEGITAVEKSRLQQSVLVVVDDQLALTGIVAANAAEARSLTIGTNFVGGSTTRESFSGEILGVERAGWREVLPRLALFNLQPEERRRMAAWASPGPAWDGYCGPLRLTVRFPRGEAGQAEPLLVTGVTGTGDFIYVRYLADGRVKFGYDHWGVGGAESHPILLTDSRRAEVVVSCGALMPPSGAELYAGNPPYSLLRRTVVVAVGEQPVLVAGMAAHPAAAGSVVIGENPIGGSTTAAQFTGEVFAVNGEPIDSVLRLAASGTQTP